MGRDREKELKGVRGGEKTKSRGGGDGKGGDRGTKRTGQEGMGRESDPRQGEGVG